MCGESIHLIDYPHVETHGRACNNNGVWFACVWTVCVG